VVAFFSRTVLSSQTEIDVRYLVLGISTRSALFAVARWWVQHFSGGGEAHDWDEVVVLAEDDVGAGVVDVMISAAKRQITITTRNLLCLNIS
jgi:hypothetical protein